MGNTRVEAQTDGGLFIEVRNLNPDATDDRLVWPRHYYVLPLEVILNYVCSLVCLCYAFIFSPTLSSS